MFAQQTGACGRATNQTGKEALETLCRLWDQGKRGQIEALARMGFRRELIA
jgi:hypothetical protein